MKVLAELNINLVTDLGGYTAQGSAGYVDITSVSLFKKLLSLGFEDSWFRPMEYLDGAMGGRISIKEPADSERLPFALKLIMDNTPLVLMQTSFSQPDKIHTHFCVRYHRSYSNRDLDTSPLLMLSPKQLNFATKIGVAADGTFVVKADHNQKSKRTFGVVDFGRACAVAEPLKSQLEAANIIGLRFRPVTILPAHKVIKPLWQFGSDFTMPRCLLPFESYQEEGYGEKYGKLCGSFEDKGFSPAELLYSKSELASLGNFDIALTPEMMTYDTPIHEVIVSQKFRKVMSALKVPGVDYVPVRLSEP